MVGVSGELFGTPALWLKADSPFLFAFVVGYANGYNGYLTVKGAWAQGGYEVSMGQRTLWGDGSGNLLPNGRWHCCAKFLVGAGANLPGTLLTTRGGGHGCNGCP